MIAKILYRIFLFLIFLLPIEHRHTNLLRPLAKFAHTRLSFYLSDILILCLFAVALTKKPLFKEKSSQFLGLFLVTCLLSIACCSVGGQLSPYLHFMSLLLPALLYMILSREPIDLQPILWTIFIASLLQCGIGITQYIVQHPIGLKYFGEISSNAQGATFYMADSSRWVGDKLFHMAAPSSQILRISGTFPHANIMGGFMGLSLLCSYLLFLKSKRTWIIGLGIFAQTLTLCLTFSRAALFGWIGISILFFLLAEKKRLLPLIGIVCVSGLLCSVMLYPQFLQRGGIVNYNALAKASDQDRIRFQKTALTMAKENPWLGTGFGQYPKDEQRVHNIYLLLLSETGILGLLTFLAFIASLFRGINYRDTLTLGLGCMMLYFLWIGCCDHYFIFFQHGRIMFFAVAGLFSAHVAYRQIDQRVSGDLKKKALQ